MSLVLKPCEAQVLFFSKWANGPANPAPQRGECLDESLELGIPGSNSDLVDVNILERREEREHQPLGIRERPREGRRPTRGAGKQVRQLRSQRIKCKSHVTRLFVTVDIHHESVTVEPLQQIPGDIVPASSRAEVEEAGFEVHSHQSGHALLVSPLPVNEGLARITLGVCINPDVACTAQPHGVRFIPTGDSRAVGKFHGVVPSGTTTTCALDMRSLRDRPRPPTRRSESGQPQAVWVGTHVHRLTSHRLNGGKPELDPLRHFPSSTATRHLPPTRRVIGLAR